MENNNNVRQRRNYERNHYELNNNSIIEKMICRDEKHSFDKNVLRCELSFRKKQAIRSKTSSSNHLISLILSDIMKEREANALHVDVHGTE